MMQHRRLLTFAALGFLCFHIALSLIYNFPLSTTSGWIKPIVFRYIFPVFNQNNKVFAPDPPFLSQHVLLHVEMQGSKKSIDPAEQYKQRLHHFPFSPALYPLRAYEYRIAQLYKAYTYADYQAIKMKERDSLNYNLDSLRNIFLLNDSLYRLELNNFCQETGLTGQPRSCSIGLYFVYHPEYKNFLKGKRSNSVLPYEFPVIHYE